jgi:LacI family transcriptional regulator
LVSLCNDNFSEEYFGEIQSEGFPIVFFDKVPNTISANKVLTNDFVGAFTATEHLIQNGYKKIAHLKGQKGARNTSPRLLGYLKALEKYQLISEEDLIIECCKCTEDEGFATTLQLMQQTNLPDAIFCVNDELAIGALAALRKLNIAVPNQVGVVGFSNSTAGEYMFPSLTTLAQSGTEIGQKATEVLINCIKKDSALKLEDTYVQYIIEPTIIIRESSQKNA